jgi:hypothetical protein
MSNEIFDGTIQFKNAPGGSTRITLSGSGGDLTGGGQGCNGTFIMLNRAGHKIAQVGASPGPVDLMSPVPGALLINDVNGQMSLSFQGASGELEIKDVFRFLDGVLRLGSGGKNGQLLLRNAAGAETIRLDGTVGLVTIKDASGSDVIKIDSAAGEVLVQDSFRYIDGTLRLGANGRDGKLMLKNADGTETIRVDGKSGDVILGNADCAEDWDLADGEQSTPGAVMVLDEDGALRQCRHEYDTAVAGVISGAGALKPAIVLDRRSTGRSRAPLAMMGKVFCQVDASFGPVRAGMLLTTSANPGHAMAAGSGRASGAVLGKALMPLRTGCGLVPIMVSLQ